MKQAVQLFQARSVDRTGQPLKIDGEVGAITWAALFGDEQVPHSTASGDALLAQVLAVAASQLGVLEQPRNSNRGPQVDAYLRRAGVRPGLAWCCAFTYWCFDEAAAQLDRANPMLRTAGCLAHWNGAPGARRAARAAGAGGGPTRPACGPARSSSWTSAAASDTPASSSRCWAAMCAPLRATPTPRRPARAAGVYRLTRKLVDINKGVIDYGD
jgi:hypothetical protein